MTQTPRLALGFAALALLSFMPAPAAATDNHDDGDGQNCNGSASDGFVSAHNYDVGGIDYAVPPNNIPAGMTITVEFMVAPCTDAAMDPLVLTLVSYNATMDLALEDQTVHDYETKAFAAGSHSLSVTIPPCSYQLDFVYGNVIMDLNPDTYHGQNRFVSGDQESRACPPPPPAECPGNLVATPNQDGSITLTFTAGANADGYKVYRAEGSGSMQFVANLGAGATSYVDSDTEVGTTYTYMVASVDGDAVLEGCGDAEATSIPEFPGMLAMGLATVLGALGFALARRK